MARGGEAARSLDRSGRRRIVQVVATTLLFGGLLFLSAGRLDWLWAWVCLSIWCLGILLNGVTVARTDPELINERGRRPTDQVGWDRILTGIGSVTFLALPVIAGLDAVRFGWSSMAPGLHAAGAAVLILALLLNWWCMMTNRYLSTVARIQSERGQEVVTTGPYRYVRHPMYVGMILLGLGLPLLLGSWWALAPGLVMVALFVVRAALEDRMLRAELGGYPEYAERVRYRLLPGIW
jgi:protein-S-isoprenylcysteine O-methyltransferase Ste14